MTTFTLFLALLFSGTAFAQTVGNSNLSCDISNRNPCTSKDLEIVSVFIDAPQCVTCTGGEVTYPLKMTIHNGTKSVRTSFALYGHLSDGAYITSPTGVKYEDNLFVCVGPITVKSDQTLPGESAPGNQTFAVGTITFTCGQNLTLTDNFLAWTDASGTTGERCNTFSQATKCSDIAPKCGTSPSITIVGPVVPPTLGKVDPTCTVSSGCVTVTSATTGFTFSLNGGAFTTYPTNGWCGLSSGQHCVRSKRTSDGCISQPACITIPGAPANPARPVVTIQEATICGTNATPSVTVSCPIVGTYILKQTGEQDQSFSYNGSNSPVRFNIKPGLGGFTITVTNAAGCQSLETNCNNYLTNSCPPPPPITQQVSNEPQTLQAQTKVTAAPNPFNDKVRFTLKPAISGKGTLDLYNMSGQKIKTVFQGDVKAGQVQNVEYRVPGVQRSSLIYVFTVGNKKVTGQLLNLK